MSQTAELDELQTNNALLHDKNDYLQNALAQLDDTIGALRVSAQADSSGAAATSATAVVAGSGDSDETESLQVLFEARVRSC